MLFPQALPMSQEKVSNGDDLWLVQAGNESYDYVRKFKWVATVRSAFLRFGVPGILVVASIEIVPTSPHVDRDLWVVSGDLPSAYFVKDDAPDIKGALSVYCELMDNWCEQVMLRGDMSDVFPVDAPQDESTAQALASRTLFIRKNIIPYIEEFGNTSGT